MPPTHCWALLSPPVCSGRQKCNRATIIVGVGIMPTKLCQLGWHNVGSVLRGVVVWRNARGQRFASRWSTRLGTHLGQLRTAPMSPIVTFWNPIQGTVKRTSISSLCCCHNLTCAPSVGIHACVLVDTSTLFAYSCYSCWANQSAAPAWL